MRFVIKSCTSTTKTASGLDEEKIFLMFALTRASRQSLTTGLVQSQMRFVVLTMSCLELSQRKLSAGGKPICEGSV